MRFLFKAGVSRLFLLHPDKPVMDVSAQRKDDVSRDKLGVVPRPMGGWRSWVDVQRNKPDKRTDESAHETDPYIVKQRRFDHLKYEVVCDDKHYAHEIVDAPAGRRSFRERFVKPVIEQSVEQFRFAELLSRDSAQGITVTRHQRSGNDAA